MATKKILLFTCGGSSNLDRAIELASHMLVNTNPDVEKVCFPQSLAQPDKISKKFKAAQQILVVNTCESKCSMRILKQIALEHMDKVHSFNMTRNGFPRKNINVNDDTIASIFHKLQKCLDS